MHTPAQLSHSEAPVFPIAAAPVADGPVLEIAPVAAPVFEPAPALESVPTPGAAPAFGALPVIETPAVVTPFAQLGEPAPVVETTPAEAPASPFGSVFGDSPAPFQMPAQEASIALEADPLDVAPSPFQHPLVVSQSVREEEPAASEPVAEIDADPTPVAEAPIVEEVPVSVLPVSNAGHPAVASNVVFPAFAVPAIQEAPAAERVVEEAPEAVAAESVVAEAPAVIKDPPAPPSPTPVAAFDPPPAPPMWHRDPSGRHELRYWDGARWTEHVSNAGDPGIDAL